MHGKPRRPVLKGWHISFLREGTLLRIYAALGLARCFVASDALRLGADAEDGRALQHERTQRTLSGRLQKLRTLSHQGGQGGNKGGRQEPDEGGGGDEDSDEDSDGDPPEDEKKGEDNETAKPGATCDQQHEEHALEKMTAITVHMELCISQDTIPPMSIDKAPRISRPKNKDRCDCIAEGMEAATKAFKDAGCMALLDIELQKLAQRNEEANCQVCSEENAEGDHKKCMDTMNTCLEKDGRGPGLDLPPLKLNQSDDEAKAHEEAHEKEYGPEEGADPATDPPEGDSAEASLLELNSSSGALHQAQSKRKKNNGQAAVAKKKRVGQEPEGDAEDPEEGAADNAPLDKLVHDYRCECTKAAEECMKLAAVENNCKHELEKFIGPLQHGAQNICGDGAGGHDHSSDEAIEKAKEAQEDAKDDDDMS